MKYRPIIFSGDSVRAILEGRKTQTRRVIEPQPKDITCHIVYFTDGFRFSTEDKSRKSRFVKGDILWVKETWRPEIHNADSFMDQMIGYKATDTNEDCVDVPRERLKEWDVIWDKHQDKWQSPLFMPRWASRISLRVKRSSMEHVKDIHPRDIQAEGIKQDFLWQVSEAKFKKVWDSINDKRGYSWDTNPFVEVAEFERIE